MAKQMETSGTVTLFLGWKAGGDREGVRLSCPLLKFISDSESGREILPVSSSMIYAACWGLGRRRSFITQLVASQSCLGAQRFPQRCANSGTEALFFCFLLFCFLCSTAGCWYHTHAPQGPAHTTQMIKPCRPVNHPDSVFQCQCLSAILCCISCLTCRGLFCRPDTEHRKPQSSLRCHQFSGGTTSLNFSLHILDESGRI